MSTGTGFGMSTQPAPEPEPEEKAADFAAFELQNAARSGANWFFWIAALSAINTVAHLSGSDWSFIAGLGVTQVLDVAGREGGTAAMGVTVILNALVLGVVVLFGVFARKRNDWAFLLGMALYALDGLIFLLAGDILSTAFHGLVLFFIWGGYNAHRKLRALQAAQPSLIANPPTA
jgi:hypothetical protein